MTHANMNNKQARQAYRESNDDAKQCSKHTHTHTDTNTY